ncbi:MAG: gluconate 2-dehydrogenase subunit 3 family protein [Saprospiraceae bacterium]|nr:gluconate 2-dehydrogenase subunit 3 family protein [Saprospiraceae bacterium]
MNRRDALKNTALLGGTAALSTSLLGLLQSCQAQARLDWEPQFLSTAQAQLVGALVDTILPTTDTPGALDVNVDVFIDLVFHKMYDEAGQKQVTTEMTTFDEDCQSKFGKVFADLDGEQKTTVLREAEANSPKSGRGVWGMSVEKTEPVGFYRSLKSLAVWAYCSSEEIGKNVLNYDPIPGPYQGCVPLSDVGKVYSL